MKTKKYLSFILVAIIIQCGFAFAAESGADDPIVATAKKIMDYTHNDIAGLLSPTFIHAIPPNKLIDLLQQFNTQYGAFLSVRKSGVGKLEYHYEKALIPGTLHLDKKGKIDGLWFGVPKVLTDTFESVLSELKALGGTVAVTIRKNNADVVCTYNGTVPLA